MHAMHPFEYDIFFFWLLTFCFMQLDCFLSVGIEKCFPLIKRGEMFFHIACFCCTLFTLDGWGPLLGEVIVIVLLTSPGQTAFSGAACVPSVSKWCGAFWWASLLPCKMTLFLCPFPHLCVTSTSLTLEQEDTGAVSLLSWKVVPTQHPQCFCFEFCCYRGFSGQKTEEVKPEKDDIINIFSVASGHLYERFLRSVFIICI